MSNYASYRSPSNTTFPVLPDLGTRYRQRRPNAAGFEWIPAISSLGLTDAIDNILIFTSVAFMLLADQTPLLSIFKMLCCFTGAYTLRSITVALTSFPDPRLGCVRIEENFFTTFAVHRCGDCMFSGHATVGTLFALYWLSVVPVKRDAVYHLLRGVNWVAAAAEMLVIIANRAHYSVDVAVAIYTSIGVYFTFAYAWHIHITARSRLTDLTQPGMVYSSLEHYEAMAEH